MEKFTGQDIRLLIGGNIRRMRTRKKISQLTLANNTGLTHNFINEIENGRKWISPDTLAKLIIALDAEPYHFFLTHSLQDNRQSEIFNGYLTDLTDMFNTKVREIQSCYTLEPTDHHENNSGSTE